MFHNCCAPRWADTGATKMMSSCLRVPTTPVVFGRAWRRGLDHVYRVRTNKCKTYQKTMQTKNTYNPWSKNKTWSHHNLEKDITFYVNNHTNNTPKYFKKTSQSDPKWLLFEAWEPPWNHGATRVLNYPLIWTLKVPQKDPFGPPWTPWGPTNLQNTTKSTPKVSIQKHNTKKTRSRTLPNLKK